MSATLHFVTSGSRDKAAVVFLHGFMGCSSDWQEQLDLLSPDFFCIAIDLPGHGKSTSMADEAYTFPGCGRAVVEVLREVNVRAATWVGYSMGGRMALYLLSESPSACEQVICVSANPGLETEADRRDRRTLDASWASALASSPFGAFLEAWYQQAIFSTLHEKPDLLRAICDERGRNDPSELAKCLGGLGLAEQPNLWPSLSTSRVPVWAMAGDADPKFMAIADRMASLSTRGKNVIVPQSGHLIQREQPVAFATLVRSFLQEKKQHECHH